MHDNLGRSHKGKSADLANEGRDELTVNITGSSLLGPPRAVGPGNSGVESPGLDPPVGGPQPVP